MIFQGWTWEYISENMTWPRYMGMRAYWRKHPPIHLVVAAFAGIKPEPELPTQPEEEFPDTLE